MTFLDTEVLDPALVAARVANRGSGAVVTFQGVVRDHHAGRQVLSLTYSAYGAMAEKIAAELIAGAEARWPVRVAARHRLGHLTVGETAIVVAASAAHRGEAFEALSWLVDAIKQTVPIWKHEQYADGTEAWVDPSAVSGVIGDK